MCVPAGFPAHMEALHRLVTWNCVLECPRLQVMDCWLGISRRRTFVENKFLTFFCLFQRLFENSIRTPKFWNFGVRIEFSKSRWNKQKKVRNLFSTKVRRRLMPSQQSITWRRGHSRRPFRATKRCRAFTYAGKPAGIRMGCRWSFRWRKNSDSIPKKQLKNMAWQNLIKNAGRAFGNMWMF